MKVSFIVGAHSDSNKWRACAAERKVVEETNEESKLKSGKHKKEVNIGEVMQKILAVNRAGRVVPQNGCEP